MPLYNEVIAALNAATITPEMLFCEEYTDAQEAVFQSFFPHYKPSLRAHDWSVGEQDYTRIFLIEGYDQDVYLRVTKYTGGGGGEFDEARFEHVRPVQTVAYEPYPQLSATAAPLPPAPTRP